MTELDTSAVAYVAGIVDTWGVIRTRATDNGTLLPFVAVHSPNLGMLDLLADLTGTKVTKTQRSFMRMGCSIHCQEKHRHVQSNSGRWSLSGAKATVLLFNVLPYLRLQVPEATASLDVGLATRFKKATVQKMAQLGWKVPEFDPAPVFEKPECSVEGCAQPAEARGWCFTHYHRWRRHGDPRGEVAGGQAGRGTEGGADRSHGGMR